MPSPSLRIVVLIIFLSISAPFGLAGDKNVSFETIPPGAEVEVNGSIACTTPCSIKVPDYYFGSKHTAFSKHGVEPITVRLLKKGFVTKSIQITTGPLHWKNLYGNNLYDYYIVTTTSYVVRLDPEEQFFAQPESHEAPVSTTTSLSTTGDLFLANEEIVKTATPAIVVVTTTDKLGSGFIISASGVVVTNAHVVQGSSSVTVVMSGGRKVESSNLFIDNDRDLALIKLPIGEYPYLRISHTLPAVGADVIAIGSPGVGSTIMTNTVTKGIVSGVRSFGDGTWIQTDASFNHGNSGGPLLNRKGEVVGVNTLRASTAEYSGMNFALASTEIDKLVRMKFGVQLDASPTQSEKGLITFNSNPSGADIEIDNVFLGTTPAELPTTVGEHEVKISKKGFKSFSRNIHVISGAKQTISTELEPESR